MSYRPARLHGLAESIPGLLKRLKLSYMFLFLKTPPPASPPTLAVASLASVLLAKNYLLIITFIRINYMVLLRMIFQCETKCNTFVTKVSISPANMTPISVEIVKSSRQNPVLFFLGWYYQILNFLLNPCLPPTPGLHFSSKFDTKCLYG